MKYSVLIATFLCAAVAVSQNNKPEQRPYKGPLCLAGFCLEKYPLPSEKRLIAQYGPGSRVRESRCYAVPEQHAYVHFDVGHDLPARIVTVFVSDVPNCLTNATLATPNTPFPTFETKEGIRIGDSYEKVVKTYGRPSSIRPGADGVYDVVPYSRERRGAPFGETALAYDGPSDELIRGEIYLRKGRVAAIYISCSE